MSMECNFAAELDDHFDAEEAYEAEQKLKRQAAEDEATRVLCNGPDLNKAWPDWELYHQISPFLMAEIFADLRQAQSSPSAVVRIIGRLEALRDHMQKYLAEQLVEA